jgi:hypothetical protein
MSKSGYATCPRCGMEIFTPDLNIEVRHECGHVTMLVQIEWPCSAETAKA